MVLCLADLIQDKRVGNEIKSCYPLENSFEQLPHERAGTFLFGVSTQVLGQSDFLFLLLGKKWQRQISLDLITDLSL